MFASFFNAGIATARSFQERTLRHSGRFVSLFRAKAGRIFTMTRTVEQLEQQLDSFDATQRKDALARLWDLARA